MLPMDFFCHQCVNCFFCLFDFSISTQGFSPNVDFSNVDWNSAPAIQDMPVISAFQYPAPGSVVASSDTIEAKGYAWAGGGRGIVRVDVSAVISIQLIGLVSQNPIYIYIDPIFFYAVIIFCDGLRSNEKYPPSISLFV